MKLLQGKTALITGASKGIGRKIAEKFAEHGANVAFTYLSSVEKGEALEQELQRFGTKVKGYRSDASKFEEAEKLVNDIVADFGTLQIVVNNAGITKDGAFRKMSYENWRAVLSTNLDSVFNCTRHVINPMIDAGFGRIINISSVNGQRGQFGQANYSAAKAGMHGFTKTLAMEVANKGITVNTISPGYIGTDMVMAVKEEVRNQIIAQIPLGRLGGTEEVAYLVSFLASEHANFITGANMSINGGQHVY